MKRNFENNKHNIEMCAARGAKLVCLPENFHYMGRNYTDGIEMAEPLTGKIIKMYKQLALDNRIWLSLGGFQEKINGNIDKRYNTHVIINEEGNFVSEYRKLHLFDIDLTHIGGLTISENKYIEPGKEVPCPVMSPIGYIGLSISNDIRYPELYRYYVQRGAQVLLVPSAFIIKTGASHWESLLRARAIEN